MQVVNIEGCQHEDRTNELVERLLEKPELSRENENASPKADRVSAHADCEP